jgi:hypothetical protein
MIDHKQSGKEIADVQWQDGQLSEINLTGANNENISHSLDIRSRHDGLDRVACYLLAPSAAEHDCVGAADREAL